MLRYQQEDRYNYSKASASSIVVQRATPTLLLTCIAFTFQTTQTSNLLSQTKDMLQVKLTVECMIFFTVFSWYMQCQYVIFSGVGSTIEAGGHCVDSYSLSQICITSVNLLISSILHKYFIKKVKINQGVVHCTEF